MITIHIVFVVIILVCLFCAAINRPSSPVNLGWLGMFFWFLDIVVGGTK